MDLNSIFNVFKPVLAIGIGISTIVTFLVPVCSKNTTVLFINRIVCGLSQAVSFPTIHTVMGKWAPNSERSLFISIIWAGSMVGTALANVISGAINDSLGWRSIYYIYGGFGTAWTILWLLYKILII